MFYFMFPFHFFGIFFSFLIRPSRSLPICKIFRWPPYWNFEKVPCKNRLTFGENESKIISASEIYLGNTQKSLPLCYWGLYEPERDAAWNVTGSNLLTNCFTTHAWRLTATRLLLHFNLPFTEGQLVITMMNGQHADPTSSIPKSKTCK